MADVELSPSMSRAELVAVHRETNDYDLGGGNLARCQIFIRVSRMLLATPLVRSSSQIRGEEVEIDPAVTRALLERAERWYFDHYEELSGASRPRQYTIDECWR